MITPRSIRRFAFTAALASGTLLSTSIVRSPEAHAQNDQITEIARQRYNEGIKAFDAGKYEEARAAFLQSYALKRHPAILLNIGQAELRSNHPEDAGNHFQQFLREHQGATADQRAAAEKGIADAKKKAGFIIVIVDATGADISIDGAAVGKSPLLDPVFVKPGKHTLYATLQGKGATTVVDAKQGSAATATLTLGIQGGPPPVQPPPAQPPPAQPPPVQPPPVQPPPAQPPPMQPPPPVQPPPNQQVPPAFGPPGPPPMDHPTGSREPFFHWYKRKPLAWVGTALTGLGLFGGIGFSAAASSSSGAAKSLADQIKAEDQAHPEYNPTGRANICGDQDGNGALPHYQKACGLLQDNISTYNTNVALSGVSWALFGIGAIGTAVYVILDWLPNKGAPAAAQTDQRDVIKPKILSIAPILNANEKGIGVLGVF